MNRKIFLLAALAAVLTACHSVPKPKPIPTGSLAAFQKKAEAFNEVVTVPTFETTPDEVATTVTNVIASGNAALDRIGRLKPGEVNFTNTIGRSMTLAIRFKRPKTGWN